ncbi:MAG: hypothetical protein H0V79_05345 [Actinobacteria bacterium]|nr:hypothetical protein [Actinomycetota bacterium]
MTERDTEIEFDFFEEPATREAARPERSSRRSGGPRGPRKPVGPQSGLTPLLRLIGLISLAILVVVGFVFWVSSCRGEAKSNRYQGYMADISQVAEESENLGTQLATTLTRPEVRQAQLISTLKGLAQQQVQLVLTARRIDPPGPLRPQQSQLVESLQFRVSGLNGLADAFKTPSRDETQAGELLAAQARRLVASDVIWDDLFKDPAKEELDSQGVQGVRVPDSNFIQNPDLTTSRSMGTVWQRTRAAGTGGTVTRPGSHGHGLTSVKVVGGSNLSSTELNKIVATTDLAFEVTFENSGDSTETGVEVQLTIQKETEPLVRTQRVDLTEPNETATVTFRDVGNVPFVQRTTLQISVKPVPSESNTANNSAEYPVIFSYPGG